MSIRRKRTETLTVRLTPEEKRLLKQKAASRKMTITDFILLTALGYQEADHLLPVVEALAQIKNELHSLQQNKTDSALDDALDRYHEAMNALMKLLRK